MKNNRKSIFNNAKRLVVKVGSNNDKGVVIVVGGVPIAVGKMRTLFTEEVGRPGVRLDALLDSHSK